MTIISRAEWGLRATWPNNTVAPSKRTGFVVHWDGGQNPKTAADEVRLLLAYHRYHLNTAKTGGFDYNLAVGPITGNIYEGRGLDVVGAHAGGANTPNIGVILIGGPGNLTEAGKRGLKEAYALACAHTGKRLKQLVHRDVNRTGCPGDQIAAWVHAGGLTGGSVPTGGGKPSTGGGKPTGGAAPAFPLPKDDWYFGPKSGPKYSVSGYFSHREDLRRWQQRMKDRGWAITADGLYGPETERIALAFQKEKGLRPDGRIGAQTWRAAWTEPVT